MTNHGYRECVTSTCYQRKGITFGQMVGATLSLAPVIIALAIILNLLYV